jgi:hypothetical protein
MKTRYNKKWYTPMDIAKSGLIQNSKGDKSTVSGNYNYVLDLIHSGRLRAKNYSNGKVRQNWLVPEDEITRYHETVTRVD